MSIRLIIAHKSPALRRDLCDRLRSADDLAVVGETSDGADALLRCRDLRPEILVLDVILTTLNGVALLEKIRAARLPTRSLVVSERRDLQWIQWAIEAGASGYLVVGDGLERLAESVRAVHDGEARLSASNLRLLVESTGARLNIARAPADLTPRERQVLMQIIEGKRSTDIATLLGISNRTVDAHRASLMHKLGARTPAELVRMALELKLV
jgi:DNA-binding NarL/FixJ family response regulator